MSVNQVLKNFAQSDILYCTHMKYIISNSQWFTVGWIFENKCFIKSKLNYYLLEKTVWDALCSLHIFYNTENFAMKKIGVHGAQ